MKILFICKHNRFRSKVAEAIFKKLNDNSNNYSESAGLIKEIKHPFIDKSIIKIMNQKGYVVKGKPRKATQKILKKFDKIFIVADNVKIRDFKRFKGKTEKWIVPDCDVSEIKKIEEIINLIETKVKELINNLKN